MNNKLAVILITGLVVTIYSLSQFFLLAAAREKSTHPYLESLTHSGKVVTTMDSGGYTYIEFKEEENTLWVACPKTQVHVDDMIEFSGGLPMKEFHSKTLNRTFTTILFVSNIKIKGAAEGPRTSMELPQGHIPIGEQVASKITVKPGLVKKADGGYTTEECYSMKDKLEGTVVRVRGRVVKFIPRIMGKNWFHIQDGTGKEGQNDLTITSNDQANVGDLVLVSGKIAYDKDFGSGYDYPVIIEDASILVE